MDKSFEGAIWVGNICQKFEAMCQGVDDFVTQDPLKYVENQVQTVGDTVRRFYSDAVHNLLPSSFTEHGNSEDQVVSSKQNNIFGTYIRSLIGIEEKPVCTEINQPSAEQEQMDLSNNHEKSLHPISTGMKEVDSDASLGTEIDASTNKSADAFLKEIDTKEDLKLMDNNAGLVVEENKTKEKLTDKKSDIDRPSQLEEIELVFPENNSATKALLFSESIDESVGILAEVLPKTSACHAQKEEMVCASPFSGTESFTCNSSMLLPSEMDFSVVSGENKATEMGLVSSSSSLSTETYSVPELLNANIVCDPLNVFSSSQGFSDSYYEQKDKDVRLAFSSSALALESNVFTDDDASSYDNQKECCPEFTQLEALVSSLDIASETDDRLDIGDPSLETVELTQKVKLDESCIIVDMNLLREVYCRAPKHRSYKKILQDSFASKRRLRE